VNVTAAVTADVSQTFFFLLFLIYCLAIETIVMVAVEISALAFVSIIII